MKSVSAAAMPLILSLLRNGDSYGYGIMHELNRMTNKKKKWKLASIYLLLKKMEINGMIKSYWKMQDDVNPRKYYTILEAGKTQLEHSKAELEMIYSLFREL